MRRIGQRRDARRLFLISAIALAIFSPLRGEEEDSSTKRQSDKKQSLQLMLRQAQQLVVRIGEKAPAPVELSESPLIHYSDDVRRLPESTLWMWQQRGLPVLFCKIERISDAAGNTKSWQYCCVPATSNKADVTWGQSFRWRSREAAFQWVPLPDTPEPRDQARARLTQMKAISREFTGHSEQTNASSRQEMRLLASPLRQYAAPGENVLDGAVFSLTSNGTNPDALLLIEALVELEAESKWRFAVVGMTGDAVDIFRGKAKVWSKPFTDGPGDYRSWMWYVSAL